MEGGRGEGLPDKTMERAAGSVPTSWPRDDTLLFSIHLRSHSPLRPTRNSWRTTAIG